MNDYHPPREALQLTDVLVALGNPIRMQVLRQLARGACACGAIHTGVTKSTMTHHWRVLREAGVITQTPIGREIRICLRRDDLEARFPGLLAVTVDAVEAEAVA